jgi:4-aminobutyrate aminotransferase-like enzyme
MYEALRRGLSFKIAMGNVLLLTPALTISASEMERALVILDTAIGTVAARRAQPSVTRSQ